MIARLIAGSGRSGTTWVLDALAVANNLRPVFEPLHPQVSEVGMEYAHRALDPGDAHPQLKEFLDAAIHGGSSPLWTKFRTHGRWLFPPLSEMGSREGLGRFYRRWRKFLRDAPGLAIAGVKRDPIVKCIHANLMLGWLAQQYRFDIVLIIRHPGAVIESELRGNWNPDIALNRYRADERLHRISGDRYRSLLSASHSLPENLAIRWVIENQVAVEQASRHDIKVIRYERLAANPGREWPSICSALRLSKAPTFEVLSRPSQQSSGANLSADESRSRPRWMSALSPDQIARIQNILDEVRCDLYSMHSPEPLRESASMEPDSAAGLAP